ncbi:MAG TPA: uracil-DNA glycosylase [Gammaproteobacteria bacterium]|nr:uracil-DNA glycosylase [Gammaproteobacteria bacterium]
MDGRRRAAYLAALGIEDWVLRRGAGTASAAPAAEIDANAPASTVSAPSPRPPPDAREAVSTPPAPANEAERTAAWEALQHEVASCTKCALHATRTRTVFGVGDPAASLLVVGEAPGAEEDRRGEPFVGRAGQLLDTMLRAIDLRRGQRVFVANMLKCRPPRNRDPSPEEVACCLPYLMRQIALIRPRLILAVGRIAAQNLLATDASLGRLRGRVHRFGALSTPLLVTYHPAYLLRTPAEKRKAWEDLKLARRVFDELAS